MPITVRKNIPVKAYTFDELIEQFDEPIWTALQKRFKKYAQDPSLITPGVIRNYATSLISSLVEEGKIMAVPTGGTIVGYHVGVPLKIFIPITSTATIVEVPKRTWNINELRHWFEIGSPDKYGRDQIPYDLGRLTADMSIEYLRPSLERVGLARYSFPKSRYPNTPPRVEIPYGGYQEIEFSMKDAQPDTAQWVVILTWGAGSTYDTTWSIIVFVNGQPEHLENKPFIYGVMRDSLDEAIRDMGREYPDVDTIVRQWHPHDESQMIEYEDLSQPGNKQLRVFLGLTTGTEPDGTWRVTSETETRGVDLKYFGRISESSMERIRSENKARFQS